MQTAETTLSHIHRYVPGAAARPLLLLHGTGGDENDLLDLGTALAPGVALLSPRGQVLEGSMNRFFRRFAEGVLDIDDMKLRTHALADFLTEARKTYSLGAPVALGFSNGANIAASLLLLRPESLAGAALLRATYAFEPDPLPDLREKPALIVSGGFDAMMSLDDAKKLASVLEKAGAPVTHRVLRAGHGLTQEDLAITAQWLASLPAV